MTMSDRIAVMDAGIVKQTGTPAEIYEAPNSRYVADFIGNVNMFDGRVTGMNGQVAQVEAAAGFAIETAVGASFRPGDHAWFAIRPEKVDVTRTKPEQNHNAVQGEVWDIAYLGGLTVFNVRLDSGMVVKATVLNTERSVDDPIGYEERVWLSFTTDCGILLEQ